jgi:hypothetical protein
MSLTGPIPVDYAAGKLVDYIASCSRVEIASKSRRNRVEVTSKSRRSRVEVALDGEVGLRAQGGFGARLYLFFFKASSFFSSL